MTSLRGLAVALLALAGLLLGPGAAVAQTLPYEIERFDVVIDVQADGTFVVTESIDVQFNVSRRGIFRNIPVRYQLDADAVDLVPAGEDVADYWRVIHLEDLSVEAVGAPADTEVTVPFDSQPDATTDAEIRIGEEDTFVTGPVSYTIRYVVEGALNEFDEGPELFWNVTGNGWDAPIAEASVTVSGAEAVAATCFQGPTFATQLCDVPPEPGTTVTAAATDLRTFEGLTVVVRFAPGVVTAPPPIIVRKWNVSDAFVGSAAAVPGAAAVALLGFGGLGLLGYRQGRDREARGAVDVRGHVDESVAARRALFAPRATPVEFRPPEGLRPGQLGLLVDEKVDDVDISGTIVDLAVRGFLTIEQLETKKALVFKGTDWKLVRGSTDTDGLLPFERTLLDGFFTGGDEVLLSDLEGSFATSYAKATRQLYEDSAAHGWFGRRPDQVRRFWAGMGTAVLLVGLVATVVAAIVTTFALVLAVVPAIGIAMIVTSGRMPHRTPRGSALFVRTLGFRRFIVTAEASRMDFAEKERIFVEYLPYAVVFDVVDHWAETFSGLGVDIAAATGGFYVWHGPFSIGNFSDGVQSFASTASSSLSTVPASSGGSGFSGGGFSGGGFGGGGGGSW